ncbi:MAG: SCP2 sterol-binding domain-containing protein [Nannocystaceae bacterium]
MSIESVTNTIRDKVGTDCGLGGSIKFNCGADGMVTVDASVVPNVVTNDDVSAQCTVKIKLGDLEDMLGGKLDPMTAFGLGKLQLEGDIGVAMKLGTLMRR